MKVATKAKEPIKLRVKKLLNGNQSLYLDIYKDGRREYEFLKLYLIPEKKPNDKLANAQTLELANAIKARKIVELQNAAHGFTTKGGRSKMNVLTYIASMVDKKANSTTKGYIALAKQIKEYSGEKTTFKQIDKGYCAGFIEHLKTAQNKNKFTEGLNVNTQFAYINKFETVLNSAIADEIISTNPFKQIKPENKPKKHRAEIVYLTTGEVKKLENTQSPNSKITQIFLFSCYTGLRYSDVKALTWDKLQKDNNGSMYINFVQKKTKKQEYLPIPKKAVEFLPNRNGSADNAPIFSLSSLSYVNYQLRIWAAAAGVKKHITFHVSRHTYATLLMSLGAGIEVISKNLGHAEIRTTQAHYAAIENKLQRQAVDLLDKLKD
jgi:integrase